MRRRCIARSTKGNLGLPPVSLAFRLQTAPRLGVTRVVWQGSSPLTAADLLRASAEDDAGRSALGAARHWLREALANGPRPAKELEAEARTLGIATRTYHEARKAERAIARKEQTPNGRWLVTLPSPSRPDREDCAPSRVS